MTFLNDLVDNVPNLSVITKIEVLGFDTDAEHYQVLSDFMSDSEILGLTEEVADICIKLRKSLKIKLPDAIIAATALANNLSLVTRNVDDFKKVPELKVTNPHELDY